MERHTTFLNGSSQNCGDAISPKVIYKFGVFPIKNSKIFIGEANPIIHPENKMPQISQEIF